MRVIQQIIEYLAEKGEIGDEELRFLRSEGFSPFPTDIAEPAPDEPDSPHDDYPEPPGEAAPRRRARRRSASANAVGVGRLKSAIASQLGAWAEPLAGLLALARRLDPAVTLVSAPLALLQAEDDTLFRAVRDAVDSRVPSLKILWKSLDFEAYRDPVPASDGARTGGTLRAYRTLLKSLSRQDAPGCGWLLRYWQVRWAAQLAEAQRRLLRTLGRLYREEFALVHRELARERHEGAFWAFTLLYSAERYAEGARPGIPNIHADESAVGAAPPETGDWLRAWGQALLMAPEPVARFLQVHGLEIGLQAASVDQSGQVILWSVRTGNEVRRFVGHTGTVYAVLFTPDGRNLLTGGADRMARLWDAATGRELLCFDNRNADGDPAWCLALSPDGKQLATGSGVSGKVCLWEMATGKRVTVIKAHATATLSLAWSPDGRYLATGGSNGLRLYDPATGRSRKDAFRTATVTCVAFSPNGKYLAAGDIDGWMHLWTRMEAPTRKPGAEYGEPRALYKHSGYGERTSAQWVTFTADSSVIVSGGDDGQVKLVHIDRHLSVTVLRHDAPVCAVALSPDEELALTTCSNGKAHVWNMKQAAEEVRFSGHSGAVWCGTFRPNTIGLALVCPTRWDKTF